MHLDIDRLQGLMRSFYRLTRIKLAVFDRAGKEVAAYPAEHCDFCSQMQGHPHTRTMCMESDIRSFERCRQERKLIIYRCHAGLIEATAPLIENHIIFGYIMFGQITDDMELSKRMNIVYKSREEIEATAEILQACISYLLLNEMITPEQQRFIRRLDEYIDAHLSDDLSAAALARVFAFSRSKLYEWSNRYLGQGLAEYVSHRRISHACQLLCETRMTVAEIAAQSGYSDYNYFCRVFRKYRGQTPRQYRADHHSAKSSG